MKFNSNMKIKMCNDETINMEIELQKAFSAELQFSLEHMERLMMEN